MAAIYLAAYVTIFRRASGREIVFLSGLSLAFGCGAMLAIVAPRWRAKRHAGRVRVRLRGRPARGIWLLLIGSVPLLAALLAKAVDLSPENQPVLSMVLVSAIALSACFTVVAVLERSLLMCEHGIVVNGAAFSPWHRIGSAGWKFDDRSQLVIGQRPWQVIAQVPAYKRERVAALLKEKTAEKS